MHYHWELDAKSKIKIVTLVKFYFKKKITTLYLISTLPLSPRTNEA